MKDNNVIDKLMNSPRIKNLGLKKETVVDILKTYNEVAFNTLLENGHIELGNGMIIEVVKLIDRVHVLRGTPYKSSRRYKLKLTMEDIVYKRIEEYYNKLQEEIL
jgi:hypothetical protein